MTPMRVDLHSHAGRCFLVGLSDDEGVTGALAAAADAGMAAIWLATVADLAVLTLDPATGLRAARDFEPGEAWTDHLRQLNGIRDVARGARLEVLLSCEGADFL